MARVPFPWPLSFPTAEWAQQLFPLVLELRQMLSHRENPWAWGVREALVVLEIDAPIKNGDPLFPARRLAPHSSARVSDQEQTAGLF